MSSVKQKIKCLQERCLSCLVIGIFFFYLSHSENGILELLTLVCQKCHLFIQYRLEATFKKVFVLMIAHVQLCNVHMSVKSKPYMKILQYIKNKKRRWVRIMKKLRVKQSAIIQIQIYKFSRFLKQN